MAIDIETLSPEERLKLLEELWDSLSSSPDAVPLTDPRHLKPQRAVEDIEALSDYMGGKKPVNKEAPGGN